MKRQIFGRLTALVGCAFLMTAAAQAKILFVETFSTGTTPTASGQWDVSETGTDFRLEVDSAGQGPGDGLLTILGTGEGGSPAWGDVIYSKQSFPRGNNLRVSYRQWIRFGSNALTAVHGPWHNSNTGPQYANMEAGIDYAYSGFKWGEGIPPNAIQGGTTLTGINSNYGGNTKNGSLLIETILGDVRGARLNWYKTDVNAVSNPTGTEKNTLGLLTDPADSRATGNAANVYLGFGNFDAYQGSTYIDDIVVENDAVANPGGPTLLFVGNSREWAATPNTRGAQTPGGDFRLRWLLEQSGYNVTFIDDHDVTTADATGKAAVLISATANSNVVGNKFASVAVPVLTWNHRQFDDLNIANTTGTLATQTQISIQRPGPLFGSLSGTVNTSVNADSYRYGTPSVAATGALIEASTTGNATQGTIITYQQGTQMENGATAPARRVAFFLGGFLSGETLTTDGKTIFKNAVAFAVGTLVPTEMSNFEVE